MWVPFHTCIAENEKADKFADHVAKTIIIIKILYNSTEFYNFLQVVEI